MLKRFTIVGGLLGFLYGVIAIWSALGPFNVGIGDIGPFEFAVLAIIVLLITALGAAAGFVVGWLVSRFRKQ